MSEDIDALSEAIALKHEPEPWTGQCRWTAGITYSGKDWWRMHDRDIGMDTCAAQDICNWRPRPYTDPEISMRLLKELLAMGRVVSALGISDAARRGSYVHHELKDFERAIAEEWLRANE